MSANTTPKEFASPDYFEIVDLTMKTATLQAPPQAPAPRRTIGFVTACAIVVANIIGTGVFTSLGFQVADIHSGFALVMLWIVGGIAALCGALCYGELSAALPRSGGEYHFLSEIYHPAIGLTAMAFGKYFDGVFHLISPVFLSFAIVWLVTLFHLGNLRTGSVFQNLWTALKLFLIAALVVAGFFVPSQPVSF